MRVATLKTITLDSSNVTESLYSEYDYTGSTSYSIGNKVYVSYESDGVTERTPHKIYEAIAEPITSYPPANNSEWSSLGATNKWKMFDGSPTSQTSFLEEIEVDVDASGADAVGVFNIVANSVLFTHIVESEIITDGDCSSDSFDKGTGWAYNVSQYDCDGSQITTSKLSQDISTLVEDSYYQITFTVSGYSAGNIAGLVGGIAGGYVGADGTYTQVIQASTSLDCGVIADVDFIGTVDDISLKYVSKYEEIDLDVIDGADYWDYFFSDFDYKEDLIWYYPQYSNATIRVKLTWVTGENAECGLLVIGKSSSVGLTQYQPTIGILDYSIKSVDAFGNTILSQGDFAKRADIETDINNSELDMIQRKLSSLRGVPALWDCNNDDSDFESLIIYGYYEKFDIMIPNVSYSTCNMSIQGLT